MLHRFRKLCNLITLSSNSILAYEVHVPTSTCLGDGGFYEICDGDLFIGAANATRPVVRKAAKFKLYAFEWLKDNQYSNV